MRIDPRLLDEAADRMRDVASFRTAWRIKSSLGMNPRRGGYVRTWIGSLPVYLGSNRRWVPVHNWLFAVPRRLCSPVPVPAGARVTDRLVQVRPQLEVVREVVELEEVGHE